MVVAYAIPAAATWLLLGLCAAELPLSRATLGGAALTVVAGYGGYYGSTEAAGRAGMRPPGRQWQVPQTMLIGVSPRRRVLVWGAILGPGFLTRNPYAGFGMLPLAVLAASSLGIPAGLAVGAGIGLAHGTARALVLLRDARTARDTPSRGAVDDQMELLVKTVFWRTLDGYLLLVVAGAAVVMLFYQLS